MRSSGTGSERIGHAARVRGRTTGSPQTDSLRHFIRHGGVLPVLAAACMWITVVSHAQNRGVYPLGMSAINSGVMPESTLTYSNQFLVYTRDQAKDNEGQTLPVTGNHTVILDMNTITWVSQERILGDRYGASASLPFSKNDLTSDLQGNLSGGSGFADSYYLPVILGWDWTRAAVRVMYGFLAPTGRFSAGANDNVGSGYWTHTLSTGQTFYLTGNKHLSLSAFQLYEFHTVQEGTRVHPGETFNLDYSLMYSLARTRRFQLQGGLAGYEQRQTTAKTGPSISPAVSEERYAINALALAVFGILPRRTSVGFKYFKEFANRATFQGNSLQVVASIGF
jgi:hypothetical protein